MKITLTPETLEEKRKLDIVEYVNVNEYFLFAKDKNHVQYDNWEGKNSYLLSQVLYYAEVLKIENNSKNLEKSIEKKLTEIIKSILGN